MSGLGTATFSTQALVFIYMSYVHLWDPARHTAPPASAPDTTVGGKRPLAQERRHLRGEGHRSCHHLSPWVGALTRAPDQRVGLFAQVRHWEGFR